MPLRSPEQFRSLYQAKVADQLVTAADSSDITLLTGRTKHTLYIQQIIVDVTTSDLVTWSFKDSATTPVVVGKLNSGPGVGQFVIVDYGSQGRALTEGKDLIWSPSSSGMAGNIHVDAYSRPSSTMTITEMANG